MTGCCPQSAILIFAGGGTLFAFIIISRDDAIFRARTRNHSVESAAIFAQCYLFSRVRAGAEAFEIITFIAFPAWKIGFAAVENPVAPPRLPRCDLISHPRGRKTTAFSFDKKEYKLLLAQSCSDAHSELSALD